jgi:hypothetical protein
MSPTMVHTEWRSKASSATPANLAVDSNEESAPRAAAAQQGPGMRALSPTVALPAQSVEPDWSLERDHGEAHDVKQSPYPNHLGCERVRLAGARTLRDTGGGEPSTPTSESQ